MTVSIVFGGSFIDTRSVAIALAFCQCFRYCATAAVHQSILMLMGGINNSWRVLGSTELFDSTTSQWYVSEDLPIPHYWLQSVVLNNTLYLLGGFDKHHKYSPQVFSTTLEALSNHQLKWNSENPTPYCRPASATLLGTDLVLIGGVDATGYEGATSNIYMLNKITKSWDIIGHTPSETDAPSTVNIAENQIIVIGGVNYDDGMEYTNNSWIGLFT